MKSSQLFARARLFGTVMPAALVVGSFALAGAARAQGGVETMIVTAQRTEENIQKVPIAVTAFSAANLQAKGISDVARLSDATPNVTFDASTPFSGSSTVLAASIRGIGQDDFALNLDPGVGVYIDGVYLARSVGANTDMLDVERVEILKGPQGTLFGRNTIGGAVNIVTREPGTEFAARGEVTGGSFQRFDVRGSVDIPVTDKFRMGISFSSKDKEGYQKRIRYPAPFPYITDSNQFNAAGYRTNDHAGGINEWNVRGKFIFEPNDAWKVTLAGDYTLVDQDSVAYNIIKILDGVIFAPALPPELTPVDGLFNGFYNLCVLLGPPAPFCGPRATVGTALGGANVNLLGGGAPDGNDRLLYSSDAGLAFYSAAFGVPLQPSFITGDPDLTYGTGNDFSWMKVWGYSATIDVSLNDHTNLKNIAGFRGQSWKTGMDLDNSPIEIQEVHFNMHQHQFSEEMQLNGDTFNERLRYVIGGYYFSEAGDLHDLVTFPGGLLQVDGPNTLATWTYAFYGNFNFKVTDQLSLTLGGRYSYEHKEFEGFQSDPNDITYKAGFPPAVACPLGGLAPGPNPFTGAPAVTCSDYFGFSASEPHRFFPAGVDTQKFYLFTPKIGLEWSPTEDLMAYFSWSKGYKSGGWTTRLSFPAQDKNGDGVTDHFDAPKFGPEKARTFEGGIKSEWFDHRLRLNLAGFRTNYLGIQQNAFVFVSPTIQNSGDAHIHGAEAEMTALLTDNFVLNASLGWLKATYVRLDAGVGDTTITGGKTVTLSSALRKTPEWKFTISPQYTIDLDSSGSVVVNLDYTYIASLFNDTENTVEIARPSINLVNASVTYKAESGHWEASVGGTNLTDERYIVSGNAQRAGGTINGSYNWPREWFATVRVKY